MTLDDYLKALGYSTYGDSNIRYQDPSGENVSPQALGQLQDSFNQFNQTDAQGRPVYGTEAYLPGTMSGAYGQGLFRLGQADAGQQLQPILDQMGASVQYDPRYGYVIPQAAQDEWSRQYGQPKGFDAFLEGLASNAPIALGGAVLGAGLGYGPFAGGSLEGGAGGAIGGGGSGIGGGFGGADLGGGMDFTDLLDNWDPSVMGDPSAYGLGGGSSLTDVQQWAQGLGGLNSDGTINWAAIDQSSAITSLGDLGGAPVVSGSSAATTSILDKILNNPSLLKSVIGSGVQGLSSLLASRAQQSAGNQANNTLMAMYQQNRADLAPYREAGYGALNQLVNLTTPGKQFDTMQLDPGYQFRLQQGQNALDNRLRAAGKFYSGTALKAGTDYNQGFASNEFGNVYNRLAGLAGTGQSATNQTGTFGANTAGQVANNQTGIGNARASGYVGLGNAVQGGIQNYQNNEFTNQLLPLLYKNAGLSYGG